jgi:oligoendopeptidase F
LSTRGGDYGVKDYRSIISAPDRRNACDRGSLDCLGFGILSAQPILITLKVLLMAYYHGIHFDQRPRSRIAILAALSLLTAAPLAVVAQPASPASGRSASDKPVATMWDLADLYPTTEAWNTSYDKTKAAAERLDGMKGTLGLNASSLFAALDAISKINRESGRLSVYAGLKADEDRRVASEQERRQQASALNTLIGEKTAWVAPEIVRLGAAKVKSFEAERRELSERFGFYLDDTLRSAPHTLGDEAEGVLAAAGNVLTQPAAIHGQLADAELPHPELTLPGAGEVRLDQPAYEKYRQATDRNERKEVFDAYWGTWK